MSNRESMPRIACFGTLIVDIITAKLARMPSSGECVGGSASIHLGGNSYSVSVNLKRLFQSSAEVVCVGSIGDDAFGAMFESALRKEGVEVSARRSTTRGTSSNLILQVRGEDRRYIFDEGANACLSERDVLEEIRRIDPGIVVFGEIPSIGLSGEPFRTILRDAGGNGSRLVVVDTLVSASEDYSWMRDAWASVDILHCNLGEGRHVTKEQEPLAICRWFRDRGVGLAVVSDGENGMHYMHGDRSGHAHPFEVVEVDATGAGDATLAGILFGICDEVGIAAFKQGRIDQDALDRILRLGSACGSLAVRSMGCIGDISRQAAQAIAGTCRG